MNYVHLALGVLFLAIAGANFAGARRAADAKARRHARIAGALFSLAALAFFVAAILSAVNGGGR